MGNCIPKVLADAVICGACLVFEFPSVFVFCKPKFTPLQIQLAIIHQCRDTWGFLALDPLPNSKCVIC